MAKRKRKQRSISLSTIVGNPITTDNEDNKNKTRSLTKTERNNVESKQSTKKSKLSHPNSNKESESDWISKLAKESLHSSETNASTSLPSKSQRIQKRREKTERRNERKRQHQRDVSLGSASRQKSKEDEKHIITALAPSSLTKRRTVTATKRQQQRLENLSYVLQELVDRHETLPQTLFVNNFALSATTMTTPAKKQPKLNSQKLQPRKNDYNGLGLARPSLYLPLDDPSFKPKLEEEFGEHVAGFFGKQRSKAVKKQKTMLWQKIREGMGNDEGLSPDERVEVLLRSGVI